jgi:phage shock protein PspC (stress-responsive transcriptional regulator)
MNEIKHIHLGRQQFTISLEAYGELKKYIDAIARQAGDAGADMTEEVESRMAELLTERGTTGDKVVLPKDVAFLKAQLGEPRDFMDSDIDENEDDNKSDVSEDGTKRLFRDIDNAMVAGVAAGLAKYLGIEVVVIRLIFIALTLFGGSGVLLYVILWLLVPEAKTNSERLQMNGMAVNIDNLKKVVNEADIPAATRRASNTVMRVVNLIVKVILNLVGLTFVAAGLAVLLGDALALVYGLVRGLQVGNEILFPVGSEQVAILICAFVVVGLFAGMLVALGRIMVLRKWAMPGWILAAVVGAFIVAASIGGGLAADAAPTIRHQYEHVQHSQRISVEPFTKLNFLGNEVQYVMQPGLTAQVHIKTLGNVDTSKVKISEKDGILTIDTRALKLNDNCTTICPYGDTNMKIVIETPSTMQIPRLGSPQIHIPVGGPYRAY